MTLSWKLSTWEQAMCCAAPGPVTRIIELSTISPETSTGYTGPRSSLMFPHLTWRSQAARLPQKLGRSPYSAVATVEIFESAEAIFAAICKAVVLHGPGAAPVWP